MFKKVLITLAVLGGLFMASPVMAEEVDNCVQVTQYGGAVGIVCGIKHEPVETGLADINPFVLASTFMAVSAYAYNKAKKLQKAPIAL